VDLLGLLLRPLHVLLQRSDCLARREIDVLQLTDATLDKEVTNSADDGSDNKRRKPPRHEPGESNDYRREQRKEASVGNRAADCQIPDILADSRCLVAKLGGGEIDFLPDKRRYLASQIAKELPE
jgi:hypothetical protein